MRNVLKYQEYLYESRKRKHKWVEIDDESKYTGGLTRFPFSRRPKLPNRIRVGTTQYNVFRFIYNSGHEGVRYTDVVKYIIVSNSGGSYDSRSTDRGYWSSQLSGTWKQPGILTGYCKKNENGRWVLTNRSLIDHFNDEKAKKLGMTDYLTMKDAGMDTSSGDFLDSNPIDWEDDLSDL